MPSFLDDNPTIRCPREGLLRYNRESDSQSPNPPAVLPSSQHAAELFEKCEYCGKKATPSLDLIWTEDPQTITLFCCAQHQQLCETLHNQKCLFEARCDVATDALTTLDTKMSLELEELLSPKGGRKQDQQGIHRDLSDQPPLGETTSKVLRFRLSCAGAMDVAISTNEESWKMEVDDPQTLTPLCGHTPFQFGICYQDGPGFQQKYYSNGMKFLTVFPDGSAQVFYPSGLLALVVVVTDLKGRVCLVYDDSHAPEQPIRAVFQSDGRATCYHSNGTICLSLESSGGQCLDETGARVRRWLWSSLNFTSAPLRPLFLSLNKNVGVRVLGEDHVFVSFLANGQQAKFSMGACCVQVERERDKPASKPSVKKDELFLLAGRIRVHLAIQQLHQQLMMPSSSRPLKITIAPRLFVVVHRLMKVSDDVRMSERDRDFIKGCLQYC